jgi:Glycosyl transferase family 2
MVGTRTQLLVARGKASYAKGRVDEALEHIGQAFAIEPTSALVLREYGRLLARTSDPGVGIDLLSRATEVDPGDSVNHRFFIDEVEQHRGLAALLDLYQLVVQSSTPLGDDLIVAFLVVRDEVQHAPSLLRHHRDLGIDHFVVIDNGSSDGTTEYFLCQPDTTVIEARGGFKQSACGSAWVEVLLRLLRPNGGWILTIDADERLLLPVKWDGLRAAVQSLDDDGCLALGAVHLDLYSDGPVCDAILEDFDLDEVCTFFDRNWFTHYEPTAAWNGGLPVWEGGARERVFPPSMPLLTKTPLIRWTRNVRLQSGWHNIGSPEHVSRTARAALLHGKFTSEIIERSTLEVERKEHFADAIWYQPMSRRFLDDPLLSLFSPETSIEYRSREQLESLGVLSSSSFAMSES